MYFSDASNCIIYQDVADAVSNKLIEKIGSPRFDDSTWNGNNRWYGRHMIKYGSKNEGSGNGLKVNVPNGYTVVWIRTANDRLTRVHVNYLNDAGTVGDLVGHFATGNRKLNRYSPDGSTGDSNNHYNWLPIALTRSAPIIIKSGDGTNSDFFVSGIAVTTNPWNHSTNSALAYHWSINNSDNINKVGSWNSNDWHNDILWKIPINSGIIQMKVLVVPSGKDKLLYFVIHNNDWDDATHSSFKVENVPVERLISTYVNPFATHHNTKPWSRYIATKIPASLIGNKTVITVEFDTSTLPNDMYIREIGTHDFFPGNI
jgi:hypothetical protein